MAKKESQDGKSKKGLPRLMELAMTQKAPMVGGMLLSAMATIASFLPYLAIYFIIQEIVGLTRISALWMCPKCWDMAAWLSVGFS